MRLINIQAIGSELALKWDDGSEQYIALEKLRHACPCATCKGETDIMGQLHKAPTTPLTNRSFQLVRISRVGGYAIQPSWADGHNTGLFSFELLKSLAA